MLSQEKICLNSKKEGHIRKVWNFKRIIERIEGTDTLRENAEVYNVNTPFLKRKPSPKLCEIMEVTNLYPTYGGGEIKNDTVMNSRRYSLK